MFRVNAPIVANLKSVPIVACPFKINEFTSIGTLFKFATIGAFTLYQVG